MPATFTIIMPEAGPADLRRESQVLRSMLESNRSITVSRGPDEPIRAGDRGGAAAVGALLVGLLEAGAAAKLVEMLASYFTVSRGRTRIVVTGPNGERVELDAEAMSPEAAAETTRRLRAALLESV